MPSLRIALAQINCTVGDLKGNAKKIQEWIRRAEKSGADIVAFPELAITGYPPEDLLLRHSFIEGNLRALREVVRATKRATAVIGFVEKRGRDLFNSAAVARQGRLMGIYRKILLPNYGVFDEKRYFQPGRAVAVFKHKNATFGVNICEDVWFKEGPTARQAKMGAKFIITLNASPYHAGKIKEREKVARDRAVENKVWIAYVNLVGGQDELVFDGQSIIVNPQGEVVAKARAFEEELLVVDTLALGKLLSGSLVPPSARDFAHGKGFRSSAFGGNRARFQPLSVPENTCRASSIARNLSLEEEVYRALVLGTRDYVRKNGFKKVVIGLSGGIDSSLTAAVACDALGKENVVGVAMPSPYSSKVSSEDARELAKNLGMRFFSVSIGRVFKSYLQTLKHSFRGRSPDVTEENLQARIRGNILMALSNKFGWLVLTTGNKSEMSVGYATLYGDMAGGFAVIKDVPKTLVYRLSEWRNKGGQVIPKRVLEKPPSAELRPGQKDTDSLPPYERLDPILKYYVEEDKEVQEIVSAGFEKALTQRVAAMVDKNEYKRRQAPPGVKITPKSFGKDRRMPITNKYKNL